MKFKLSLLLSFLLSSSVHAGVGQAWAWDSGKISNNGSVTLQSNNGSSSYGATQNPTGAVAKANQSSVTQPPTVIIQATSGSSAPVAFTQATPMLISGTSVPPTCPSGYTAAWTISSAQYSSCNLAPTYNVAGTRFTFAFGAAGSGNYYVGWFVDGGPQSMYSNSNVASSPWANANQQLAVSCYSSGFTQWAGTLCTK